LCSGENLNITLESNQNTSFIWNALPNPNIGGASINNQTSDIIEDNLINLTSIPQTQQYMVTSVLEPQGCQGQTITLNVLVNPLPISDFSISSTCDSDTIFTTNLSNPANLFVCNFGDGSNSFLFEPWHLLVIFPETSPSKKEVLFGSQNLSRYLSKTHSNIL
jgi:hypothetical protein